MISIVTDSSKCQKQVNRVEINIRFHFEIEEDGMPSMSDPVYKFCDRVKVIDFPSHHSEWKEYKVCALDLYAPTYEGTGTLMLAPEWRYGVRNLNGKGELKWYTEQELTSSDYAHLLSDQMEF